MKIAILLKSFVAGGVERNTLVMSRLLAERGHDVSLIVFKNRGPLASRVDPGVRLKVLEPGAGFRARVNVALADPGGIPKALLPVLLPAKAEYCVDCLPNLAETLSALQPDAILAATPFVNLCSLWARRLAGIDARVVINERIEISHYLAERNGWRHSKLLPLMGHLYPQADAIISVSDGVADDLSRSTGLPRQRIQTIYNPVVTHELELRSRENIGHEWLDNPDIKTVVTVGRLAEQKDHPMLLKAFAKLREREQVKLLIVGGAGDDDKTRLRQDELELLARSLNIAQDVALLGYMDNPYPVLRKANLFALSSRYEGLPTVLVEAMACGCPVVSTDCPGAVEIMRGGQVGELVPIGDYDAMANAMQALLQSPTSPELLAERASDFDADSSVDRFLECLGGPATECA